MISIERFAQNSPRFCFYLIYHSCKPPKKQRNDSGRMKHFIQKKELGNPCHKAFTLFAADKKKLAQSLPCKDAKPLRFLLQVLYSFMRRVASVFSTGRGFQNQVIDSMATWSLSYTAIGLGRISTTWLRITVFLASSKQTHLFAIHVKYTKCRATYCKSNLYTDITSHYASLHLFTIIML